MKHTTMNGKYRATAINGEVIDNWHEGLKLITQHTCPDCGAIWYTYFEVYSYYEDKDAGTEPYEEWLYVSARCTACQPAARQNTYFFADRTYTTALEDSAYEPKEDRYEIVYDYHDYDFYTDTAYVTHGITERYTDHSDAINRLAELRNDPNAEHIEIIDTDFDF